MRRSAAERPKDNTTPVLLRDVAVAARPFLVGYARSRGVQRADAEDLVGETFAKALTRYDRLKCASVAACRALLIKILINTSRDAFRRQKGPVAGGADGDPADAAVSSAPDPARAAERSEQVALARRALERLPAPLRRTAQLYYLDGKSCRQIAAATGAPEGTVISRLARSRDLIRMRLHADGIDTGRLISGRSRAH